MRINLEQCKLSQVGRGCRSSSSGDPFRWGKTTRKGACRWVGELDGEAVKEYGVGEGMHGEEERKEMKNR